MNSRLFSKWGMVLGLAALPFAGGCLQQANSSPEHAAITNAQPLTNPTPTAVATLDTNSVVALPAASGTNAEVPAVDITEAPYKPLSMPKAAPASVRTNGPVGEIIKMADSGVDEGVLLAFVTNSTSVFSLSADEIIYLNDIGVPGSVVTAMIQHDQALKEQGTAPQPTQMAAVPAQPEQQQEPQQPANVAPQSTAGPPPPAGQVEQVPVPQQQAPVTYDTFYSSLSPYGNWVNVDGYGNVWQPSVVVVNPTWSPYVNSGRWVYTDYGWYWASDYSWGWAPFHYGRWFRHYRLGWCWYPDTVWGPSWVTWRYNSGYCGWAPLPPGAYYRPGFGLTWWGHSVGVNFSFGLGVDCFSFVAWNHFHDHGLHGYRLHHDHAERIWHDTVVATRIQGNRGYALNRGLPPERVTAATGVPVRAIPVRDGGRNVAGNFRGERVERGQVTVYRPHINEPSRNPLSAPSATLAQRAPSAPSAGTASGARDLTQNANRSTVASRQPPTPAPSRTWEKPIPATAKPPQNPVQMASITRENTRSPLLPAATENRNRTETPATTPNRSGQSGASSLTPGTSGSRGGFTTPSTRVETPRTSSGTATANTQRTTPQRPSTSSSADVTHNWTTPTTPSTTTRVAPTRNVPSQSSAGQNVQREARVAPSTSSQGTWNMTTPQPNSTVQAPRTTTERSRSSSVYSQPSAPSAAPAPSAPVDTSRQYRAPNYQTPQQTAPRYTAPQPTVPRETYQAPTRSYEAPSRSYEAPVRSAPAPSYSAPSYSAPARSAPSPSYSAPAPSYSAPAPSRSAPSSSGGDSRSSSSQSSSSQSGRRER